MDTAPDAPRDRAPPEPLYPTSLLDRVAAELLQCRAILSRVEHSVHDILDQHRAGGDERSWQRNLQDIDLLEQNLGDLALCLQNAARDPVLASAQGLEARPILAPLRLDDLRQRLTGRISSATARATDVEVF
jgi:hypothetical protein